MIDVEVNATYTLSGGKKSNNTNDTDNNNTNIRRMPRSKQKHNIMPLQQQYCYLPGMYQVWNTCITVKVFLYTKPSR